MRMVGYHDGAFALDVDPVMVVVVPCHRSALKADLALLLSVAVAFVGKCMREGGERVSSPQVWWDTRYNDGAFDSDVNPVVVIVVCCHRSALEVDLALLLSIVVAFVGKCTRKGGERVSSSHVWWDTMTGHLPRTSTPSLWSSFLVVAWPSRSMP